MKTYTYEDLDELKSFDNLIGKSATLKYIYNPDHSIENFLILKIEKDKQNDFRVELLNNEGETRFSWVFKSNWILLITEEA